MDYFSANLKLLCGTQRSISALCREIGINRQQFNKYLSGESQPSAYNLRRIAVFFGVPSEDLFLPSAEFSERHEGSASPEAAEDRTTSLLSQAFPGQLRRLRPLLGYYHSHFSNVFPPHTIVRGLVHLFEVDGKIYSKNIERNGPHVNPKYRRNYISKYDGLVSCLGDLIFIIEFQTLTTDALSETILYPPYRTRLDILTGLTMGVSTIKDRRPYCSHIAWKYLGPSIELRQALSACGSFADTDRTIDPKIRAYLKDKSVTVGANTME